MELRPLAFFLISLVMFLTVFRLSGSSFPSLFLGGVSVWRRLSLVRAGGRESCQSTDVRWEVMGIQQEARGWAGWVDCNKSLVVVHVFRSHSGPPPARKHPRTALVD